MLNTWIQQLPGSGQVVTAGYPAKFSTHPTSSVNSYKHNLQGILLHLAKCAGTVFHVVPE